MGIMLGGSGNSTITKVAGTTGKHWGRQIVAKVPVETLRQINKVLGPHFITKYGTKQRIIVLGRVAPFGIGAVIGGGANAALASLAVRAGRRAFGTPPTSWVPDAFQWDFDDAIRRAQAETTAAKAARESEMAQAERARAPQGCAP